MTLAVVWGVDIVRVRMEDSQMKMWTMLTTRGQA